MNDDNYTPGYAVDTELLLRYLIEKSEELSHGNRRAFSLPFQGLGAGVLAPFPELYQEFKELTLSPDDPIAERAVKCKGLFIEALGRPQEWNFKDPSDDDEDGEDRPFIRAVANRFAWDARREGEEMVEQNDFRFLSIWEMLSFIALQGDAERLKEFEKTCQQYSEPKEKVERVIPLLWDALRANMKRD